MLRPYNLIRANVQGDREAAAGLPVSAMCNRQTMHMPRAQLGFINIFLKVRTMHAEWRLGPHPFSVRAAINVWSAQECSSASCATWARSALLTASDACLLPRA
jgi:hypothetical protein